MTTIFVSNPSVSYTDYCLTYRKVKQTTKGCLRLLTFVDKMKKGKFVKIGDVMFVAPPSGIN